jgi:hypothetical protein
MRRRDGASEAIHGKQEGAASERGERAAQQHMDEPAVAAVRDRGRQPQAAAHVEREGRPPHAAPHTDPDLIGLDLPRGDTGPQPVVQEGGVRPRLVRPRLVPPRAHRPLVQREGRHDGREGAAVEQQRESQRHRRLWVVQPIKRCVRRRGEGAPAGPATIAPLSASVHTNVAPADRPLLGAGQMGAGYRGRVHAASS